MPVTAMSTASIAITDFGLKVSLNLAVGSN
jgi:hypothetical protein